MHSVNKYIKFHKELIKMALIFRVRIPNPKTMTSDSRERSCRREGSRRFVPAARGLDKLDTPEFASVYSGSKRRL